VEGKNHGVHALLVPLRDEEGNVLPGVRIEDNGYKMGLNGVDNARIWFDDVRVPRENLLNRFGDVDENGVYTSPIEDPSKRFFTMLGTLVGGRVFVPRAGLSAAKSGIAIAVKWALRRRQFGPSYTEPETLLLDYPSHQRRLMPLLAKSYALHFALRALTGLFLNRNEANIREVETLAAGMKAYSTWFTTSALQECREACGGKGYLSENRFDRLKADTDIFTTFEGDNTVLMQLVARGVMTRFRKAFSDEGVLGILRFVGSNIATDIMERNPIIVRKTDREHLLDGEFHLDGESFEINPVTWYTLAEYGIAMRGPAPQRVGVHVDDAERRTWVRENLDTYWRSVGTRLDAALADDDRADGFDGAVLEWTVLGVARMLFTYETGDVASKTAAGEWAAIRGPDFRPLLEAAIEQRRRPGTVTRSTLRDAVEFVDQVLAVVA